MTQATPRPSEAVGDNDKISGSIHRAVVWLAALLFVSMIIVGVADARHVAFQLHFNTFALFSAASLASTLVAFALILRIRRQSEALVWFAAFLMSIAAWAAGEMMSRLSATPEAAVFWIPAGTPGSVFMPITLYLFTLAYTRPKFALQSFVLPIMLAVAVLFVYVDNKSGLIAHYHPEHMQLTPWGYMADSGSAYGFVALWAMLLPAACIVLLYRFRKQSIDRTLRKQAQLFMWAIAIPLVGGSLTDGILPTLGLRSVLPLSVMLLTVTGVIISYGILKYRFFTVTPSVIANEILGTMHEAVVGIQPDFRINFVNNGAEQLFGLSAKELAGKRLSRFWEGHASRATIEAELRDALGKGRLGMIESARFRASTGVSFTAKISITRLSDGDQPYGYLIVMTDITALAKSAAIIERKVEERTRELREEQAKLSASIDSLSLGFMLVDDQGAIAIQNQALQTIFGFKASAGTVQHVDQRLSGVNLAEECARVRNTGVASEMQEVNLGARILHLFIAPVRIKHLRKEGAIGTVVLVQDITEEKVFARSRDEFFSIASHELRTPLTAIQGNTSMIQQYYPQVLKDPGVKEMITDIHTSSVRLIEIVNDFLDASRLEQGKMKFTPAPLQLEPVIEKVVHEMAEVSRSKHVVISFTQGADGPLPLVYADADRVTQVVYNLIGNAMKFTEHGEVTIDCRRQGGFVKIQVSDTGIGISPEGQQILFHKFQQSAASILTRDNTRGTGLGLYISKLLIQHMGGKIKLEHSEMGKGSTFSFTLPVATPAQREEIA